MLNVSFTITKRFSTDALYLLLNVTAVILSPFATTFLSAVLLWPFAFVSSKYTPVNWFHNFEAFCYESENLIPKSLLIETDRAKAKLRCKLLQPTVIEAKYNMFIWTPHRAGKEHTRLLRIERKLRFAADDLSPLLCISEAYHELLLVI